MNYTFSNNRHFKVPEVDFFPHIHFFVVIMFHLYIIVLPLPFYFKIHRKNLF